MKKKKNIYFNVYLKATQDHLRPGGLVATLISLGAVRRDRCVYPARHRENSYPMRSVKPPLHQGQGYMCEFLKLKLKLIVSLTISLRNIIFDKFTNIYTPLILID